MSITNLKVNQQIILNDDEYILDLLQEELRQLDKEHELPQWAYLSSEWSTYITTRVRILKQLRKLQVRLAYNSDATELVL